MCKSEFRADVLPSVRHGTKLLLRNKRWLVSDEEVGHVYIARHVLDVLGVNNRVLLAAVADRAGSVIDVTEALQSASQSDAPCREYPVGIESMLKYFEYGYGSTYLSEGGVEEDCLKESNVYVDRGEYKTMELEKELDVIVDDARKNGLSEQSADRFADIIQRYPVFGCGCEKPLQPWCRQRG